MLSELHLRDVGPSPALDVEFADRLNIFTGDNGLGKTFLLDCAWWALTRAWRREPLVHRGVDKRPTIQAVLDRSTWDGPPSFEVVFNTAVQQWVCSTPGQLTRSLVVYAGADGMYSVYDPIRNGPRIQSRPPYTNLKKDGAYVLNGRMSLESFEFSPTEIWEGIREGNVTFCNGLIHDWVNWQLRASPHDTTFAILSSVLQILSHPDEQMTPGRPTLTSIDEVREIPTICLPYGEVPVTAASAGMKRIISISYLLVWAWYQHGVVSQAFGLPPADRLVLLIDEAELHLHPKWQRSIIPALVQVAGALSEEIKTQLIFTTHSPLVLASVEPEFDKERDRLFLFDVNNGQVELNELPWAKHGDATNWLTSPIFGLAQARSRESETAIEAAEAFMRGDFAELPEGLKTKEQIHAELCRVVAGHDEFWPRWIVQECEVTR